jgi:hypothetical protein
MRPRPAHARPRRLRAWRAARVLRLLAPRWRAEMAGHLHVLAALWLHGLSPAMEPPGYLIPATDPACHPVVAWSYRTPAYTCARPVRALNARTR